MEVRNDTKMDTEYRTVGSTPPKRPGRWSRLNASQSKKSITPKCPYDIEFRVNGKVVLKWTCKTPLKSISLVQAGSKYKVKTVPLPEPPRPTRRSTDQAGDGHHPASRA